MAESYQKVAISEQVYLLRLNSNSSNIQSCLLSWRLERTGRLAATRIIPKKPDGHDHKKGSNENANEPTQNKAKYTNASPAMVQPTMSC